MDWDPDDQPSMLTPVLIFAGAAGIFMIIAGTRLLVEGGAITPHGVIMESPRIAWGLIVVGALCTIIGVVSWFLWGRREGWGEDDGSGGGPNISIGG